MCISDSMGTQAIKGRDDIHTLFHPLLRSPVYPVSRASLTSSTRSETVLP